MKIGKILLASVAMAITSVAGANSGLYEIEVKGLAGLELYSGATIWQPQPLYPKLAMRRGLSGEVLVQYDVNAQGKAENIVVLESSPKGFFNNATVRALEHATFGVAYSDGRSSTATGIYKRFIYNIEYLDDKANYQVSVK